QRLGAKLVLSADLRHIGARLKRAQQVQQARLRRLQPFGQTGKRKTLRGCSQDLQRMHDAQRGARALRSWDGIGVWRCLVHLFEYNSIIGTTLLPFAARELDHATSRGPSTTNWTSVQPEET